MKKLKDRKSFTGMNGRSAKVAKPVLLMLKTERQIAVISGPWSRQQQRVDCLQQTTRDKRSQQIDG